MWQLRRGGRGDDADDLVANRASAVIDFLSNVDTFYEEGPRVVCDL